jgi:PAS domain S-box-containing protein
MNIRTLEKKIRELEIRNQQLYTKLNNSPQHEKQAIKTEEEGGIYQQDETIPERRILYDFFMKSSALFCVLKGPNHVFEFANPSYRQYIGNLDPVGRPVREILPALGPGHFERLDNVYSTGTTYTAKETQALISREGENPEEAYFDFTYHPIRGVDGCVDGVSVFAIPVTEQVKARKEMEENAARIHLIAEAMPQKVWTACPLGNVNYVNRQWLDYAGLPFEELKGWGWQKIVHPEDWETNQQIWQYSIDTGTDFELEHRFKRKDGKYRWHLDRGQAVRDDTGAIVMWVGTNTDINDKKRTEEKLDQAKKIAEHSLMKGNKALAELTETKKQLEVMMKVKEQFLLNMSHEIRTPMNAIIGFTGLIFKTPLSQEQKEYIDAIRTSGENLLVIINDILDFSKIQAGKIQFEKINFRLSQLMPTVIELMLPKSIEKNIKLSATIDKRIPKHLLGDPTRLNQILLNLIGNAIKFTEKGEVKITIKKLSENDKNIKLEFSVSDTGIGIPEKSIISIFEEFTQATGNITRKYGGTGLGLAIVKQLVEAQGGFISVKSKVGEGSVFTFTIVYGKENGPAVDIEKKYLTESEASVVVENLSILLVEDNLLNQKLAMKILGDWNWKVELAENGAMAIQKIKRKNYDLILMDIQLPEMDGYEATSIIRKQMSVLKSKTPIIALTAHAMATEEQKCYKAGMDGYISKPFNPKKLYMMVLTILKKSGYFLKNNTGFIAEAQNLEASRPGRAK